MRDSIERLVKSLTVPHFLRYTFLPIRVTVMRPHPWKPGTNITSLPCWREVAERRLNFEREVCFETAELLSGECSTMLGLYAPSWHNFTSL